ncbi:iron-siderophore ABC transporter substrate-binding protein [Rhodococcus sp. D2-41]|uniref:ABC transporter substrate-binding protein n=1 Tax=Speluncibacter jeojiensis TaxID=2710754 RepID=UPI00240F1356|nr:iron-siderophore ABC transporter substrate-binding protein [Rhodococcus sp. D2-41]MDG3008659.1 iron-siderophore ABC transporter substrate-binding protein [Rhodococcus sp. D2-41]
MSTTAVALLAAVTLAGCSTTATIDQQESSIVKSTTRVAGAEVLGNARHPETACGPTAPVDPAGTTGATRQVTDAAGTTAVPTDPTRIVVLDPSQLDAACALGLQDRVVGAATLNAGGGQPEYLGPVIGKVPAVGTLAAPDLGRIADLKPDLILGAASATPQLRDRLSAIAPTVLVDTSPTAWRQSLLVDAAALGRAASGQDLLDRFDQDSAAAGKDLHATQTQASIVRFTGDAIELYGPASFAGQVLTDVGVQRPAPQRFTDHPDVQIDTGRLSEADGDVIYTSFAGAQGLSHGKDVMETDAWKDLGGSLNRTFAVSDEIWIHGVGLVAARDIVDDLRLSLNNYVG